MKSFIDFLNEAVKNPMLIDELMKHFKAPKYKTEKVSGKRFVVKTDDDRITTMKLFEQQFKKLYKNAKYDPNIKGSTVGALVVDGITIMFKPKTKPSPIHYELAQVKSLHNQLVEIKDKLGYDYVPFKFKNKVYKVVDAEITKGTPKSDFHFIDIDGKECLWISHKAGSGAKAFQQWGGITEKEHQIFSHPETVKFVNDMRNLFANIQVPNGFSGYRKIKDSKLKCMAVYGKEFNGPLSQQNVAYVAQGDIKIVKNGSEHFTLDASSHMLYNGDSIDGEYEPVFFVRRGEATRTNLGISHCRAGIIPIKSRAWPNGEI